MKIAISATGPTLDAEVDPRFGRCRYLVVIDPETMDFEAVENPNVGASGGAGIATAQMAVDKGVEVVLTGNLGPNASQVLAPAGIQVVTGVSGSVRDAVEGYKAGHLRSTSQLASDTPSVVGGMGRGMRRRMGGMGRGIGGGMGGIGGGMMPVPGPAPQPPGPAGQDIEELKQSARTMRNQLEEIERRIDGLERKSQ